SVSPARLSRLPARRPELPRLRRTAGRGAARRRPSERIAVTWRPFASASPPDFGWAEIFSVLAAVDPPDGTAAGNAAHRCPGGSPAFPSRLHPSPTTGALKTAQGKPADGPGKQKIGSP